VRRGGLICDPGADFTPKVDTNFVDFVGADDKCSRLAEIYGEGSRASPRCRLAAINSMSTLWSPSLSTLSESDVHVASLAMPRSKEFYGDPIEEDTLYVALYERKAVGEAYVCCPRLSISYPNPCPRCS
jgi:hypothetical protein